MIAVSLWACWGRRSACCSSKTKAHPTAIEFQHQVNQIYDRQYEFVTFVVVLFIETLQSQVANRVQRLIFTGFLAHKPWLGRDCFYSEEFARQNATKLTPTRSSILSQKVTWRLITSSAVSPRLVRLFSLAQSNYNLLKRVDHFKITTWWKITRKSSLF